MQSPRYVTMRMYQRSDKPAVLPHLEAGTVGHLLFYQSTRLHIPKCGNRQLTAAEEARCSL